MCCIVKCCNYHILSAVDMAGVACQGLVCVCMRVCEVGKMAKDIGMTIRKGIVVSFLPCLVAFGDSIPICSFIFFNVFCYLFLLFFGGEEKGMNAWCLDGVVVWGSSLGLARETSGVDERY